MEKSHRNVDWRVLCEQVSKEQDPGKLLRLVQRLNEALEERRQKQVQRQFHTPPDVVPGPCGEGDAGPILNY
jgi:hypothetical protein